MKTLAMCALAITLMLPAFAAAQTKEKPQRPGYQLILGKGKALPGIQNPVFVAKVSASRALIIPAQDLAAAKKKLRAAFGDDNFGFLEITRGLVVQLGGPKKNSAKNRWQDGIHLATYKSLMRCDVDIRKSCSGEDAVLGAKLTFGLTRAQLRSARAAARAPATKAKK